MLCELSGHWIDPCRVYRISPAGAGRCVLYLEGGDSFLADLTAAQAVDLVNGALADGFARIFGGRPAQSPATAPDQIVFTPHGNGPAVGGLDPYEAVSG
jgi:hypothetical protein